jgi:[acyl-carrier-protein] S-malonyltransferase
MKQIAFIFPGGGTQYVGMGKLWYQQYKAVRLLFEEANDILGYNLKKICFEGSLDTLSKMEHSQPAIFLVSIAALQVLSAEADIKPAMACGHSLGEYAALHAAGVLPLQDALEMIGHRGQLLQAAGNTLNATMMAVNKLDSTQVESACRRINDQGGSVYIAVYNSPRQHVISGARKDIALLEKELAATGGDVTVLNINTPSHCPLMAQAAAAFAEKLQHYIPGSFAFPVISNVKAAPYTGSDEVFDTLVAHMIQPVKWADAVGYMEQAGIRYAIELGPQAVLKNLMPYISAGITTYAMDVAEDLKPLQQLLSEDAPAPADFIQQCMAIAVSTKNYNEDQQQYEAGVVKPYRELSALTGNSPQDVSEARILLQLILDNKLIPAAEKAYRLSLLR